MLPIKISAVVITLNEEKKIGRCLSSLMDVADEIIVVDSFSTDRTEEICKSFEGVRFIRNKFPGYIEQKNFAVDLATCDYVLSLDADECLSDELKKSILSVKSNCAADSYAFNRLTNYCGAWIRHCGWYPDRKIRLWNKEMGRWGGENPHDTVVMHDNASTHFIDGDLLHYSYDTLSDHIRQIDNFSTVMARESFRKGKKASFLLHIVLYPFFTFLNMYFLKRGFMDGYAGFLVSLNSAWYKSMKYAKLWHMGHQGTTSSGP